MSVISDLVDQFTEDWSDHDELSGVWPVATQAELNAFSRVTVIVSQQTIGPFPPAPNSHRTVGVTLEVVSPLGDVDSGAEELDSIVPAILDYLDPKYQQSTATSFLYGKQFAYRIPISVIASKE